MPRILVTGVNGQIGSYLAELLVSHGHEVLGIGWPYNAPYPAGVVRCEGELNAEGSEALLAACGRLHAVVHLAGMSSVSQSWKDPLECFDANARFTMALAQHLGQWPGTHLVHASSAEIFGKAASDVLHEDTPISPVTPYGVSKAAAHMAVRMWREARQAPMSNMILLPAESERRALHFVFRKITRGLAAVRLGLSDHLALGDTSVVRDFLHAQDAAAAIARVAVQGPPGDYVVCSGEGHSVREVAETACEILGLDPATVLRTDLALLRLADVPRMVGDNSRLRALGWAPTLGFRQLIQRILDHDVSELRAESNRTT
jgi:GDPmannose 4,6-dehydratase